MSIDTRHDQSNIVQLHFDETEGSLRAGEAQPIIGAEARQSQGGPGGAVFLNVLTVSDENFDCVGGVPITDPETRGLAAELALLNLTGRRNALQGRASHRGTLRGMDPTASALAKERAAQELRGIGSRILYLCAVANHLPEPQRGADIDIRLARQIVVHGQRYGGMGETYRAARSHRRHEVGRLLAGRLGLTLQELTKYDTDEDLSTD